MGGLLAISILLLSLILTTEASSQQIELQIGKSGTDSGQYFCWSPVQGRVRQVGSTTSGLDVTLLSAQVKGGTGKVRFFSDTGKAITRAASAGVDSLSLSLPGNGSWVNFYVGGAKASAGSKDVVVRVELADGTALAETPVMVRVRKDAESLSPGERDAFLRALRHWADKPGLDRPTRFEDYFTVHNDAFQMGISFDVWHAGQ
jgi:tyrosinase